MYTPKISTKRVLGLVMASALAVSGVVAVAGSSEAAVTAAKLSPTTGSTAGGTIVVITGKGFANAAGVSQVGKVWFNAAATPCAAVAGAGTNPVVSPSVVSATKIVITTPALTLSPAGKATAFNLCVQNLVATTSGVILGGATFTAYPAPTINDQTLATRGLSVLTGASYGGGTIVITGENFTSKSVAKIGSTPLVGGKVVIGSGTSATATGGDDTITGKIPAGIGTAKVVSVTSEGGTVNALTSTTQAFNYLDALKITPSTGDGTVGNVITVIGTGFSARTFSATAAANTAVVALKPVGALYTGATTIAGITAPLCTNIQVVSDTELNCQLPAFGAAAVGGYTVMVIDLNATVLTAQTAASTSAQYSVAAF